jgi:hypothetical protein
VGRPSAVRCRPRNEYLAARRPPSDRGVLVRIETGSPRSALRLGPARRSPTGPCSTSAACRLTIPVSRPNSFRKNLRTARWALPPPMAAKSCACRLAPRRRSTSRCGLTTAPGPEQARRPTSIAASNRRHRQAIRLPMRIKQVRPWCWRQDQVECGARRYRSHNADHHLSSLSSGSPPRPHHTLELRSPPRKSQVTELPARDAPRRPPNAVDDADFFPHPSQISSWAVTSPGRAVFQSRGR